MAEDFKEIKLYQVSNFIAFEIRKWLCPGY
jgi:hypothetical protein